MLPFTARKREMFDLGRKLMETTDGSTPILASRFNTLLDMNSTEIVKLIQ